MLLVNAIHKNQKFVFGKDTVAADENGQIEVSGPYAEILKKEGWQEVSGKKAEAIKEPKKPAAKKSAKAEKDPEVEAPKVEVVQEKVEKSADPEAKKPHWKSKSKE